MSDNSRMDKKSLNWAKKELDIAVRKITDKGVIESPIIESRPSWFKPFDVVIGQLRDQGVRSEFLWVIGGTVPTDCIHSTLAATARDAARHFSLKWQLEAARYENPAEQKRLALDPAVDWKEQGRLLTAKAEYLYKIVDDDQLWS